MTAPAIDEKERAMLAFWSERARAYGADPRANTNDVHLRSLETVYVSRFVRTHAACRVLDLGCGNGFTTRRLAERHPEATFLGIDINPDMIAVAREPAGDVNPPNVSFRRHDIRMSGLDDSFDLAIAIRTFQNMPSLADQCAVADALLDHVRPGGVFLAIESYEAGMARLDDDRKALGLPPLPAHPHLTLLDERFDSHVAGRAECIDRSSIASTYYLVTRLAYSHLAQTRDEAIDYDHELHRVAARMPQTGDYGPLVAAAYRAPTGAAG